MRKKNILLAAVLIVCLILSIFLALVSDYSDGVDGYGQTVEGYSLVISEICSKNETIIADNEGKYRDYVELYNPGQPLNLAGFTFTDGKGTSDPLGQIILGAGEHRIFFLSKETTGFSLGSSGGDCVQLLDPWGNIVVQANTSSCTADQVMLYRSGTCTVSSDASPGFPNTAEGLAAFREGIPAEDQMLIISEILIDNTTSFPDENGLFSDVLELHNASGQDLDLGRCFLSDSMDDRFCFRLPDTTLPADAYLVIFCDGGNYLSDDGRIHTNFALSHGETLVLTDASGAYTAVDVLSAGRDLSTALTEDCTYAASPVTLGYPNTESGRALFLDTMTDRSSPLVVSEVLLSAADVPYNGALQDVVEILNRSEETVDTSGWYLSDGKDPYAYSLPAQQLAPGARMVIPCSVPTTGFSLSEGETVSLLSPDYLYAPAVVCIAPELNTSISLSESSTEPTYILDRPTLGYANTPAGHSQFRAAQQPEGLIISELMSANRSWLKGAYATTCDWVELYNNSDSPVNLADYALSGNADNPVKYRLPDQTVAPRGYCVIFLSTDSKNLLSGYPVLPFSLSSQGDQLYLSRENMIHDYVFIPALPSDLSYGRAGGSGTFSLLGSVSPGKENGSEVEMSASPTVQTPQGAYDGVDHIEVVLSAPGDIYYTTDCTVPTPSDKLYTGPIPLTSTTVLRVMCQEPGKLPSEVTDLTYLINEETVLPAVSIVTEPDNLWSSSKGIYIAGPGVTPEPPHYGANYWKDWEREASISLFETDGTGFYSKCGIKIFGAYTRSLPKKSLACFFRDTYGNSELRYPLFGEDSLDTYESLILRTAGQDAFRGRMRDVVLTSLLGEATDVPVQQYKPVVVYLNGSYWGLHYIREKLNENYVAGHYQVPADTVTIVEHAGWSSPEYRQLINYVLSHDMAVEEYYDYVCSQIDVDNYIDLFIAQIWINNTDNGNVKYFRIGDGKWTWFFYDTDLSFSDVDRNSVFSNLTLAGLGKNDYTGRTFAARMLKNDEFREKFLTRMAWQMNNIWTEENIVGRIDEIQEIIRPIMPRECQRWNRNYDDWEDSVDMMRYFARERNRYMIVHIRNFFGLTDEEMQSYGFDVKAGG